MRYPKQPLLIAGIAASVVGVGLTSFVLYTLSVTRREVAQARSDLRIVLSKLTSQEDDLVEESEAEPRVRFSTLGDAEGVFNSLGENPSADQLAEAILKMDGWLMEPDDEVQFTKLKLQHQDRLRQLVKDKVMAHQEAALNASTSSDGAKEHAEAGRTLVMYPMSDEPAVLEEAKRLAFRQAEMSGRLEALRRQRYNRWATGQIEKALEYYNANVSHYNPFNDNAVLIELLVKNLGEVDPAGLEPAVLELYNYVIDRTKGSISEKNKLELAKRLTDPSIRRKALGDL